MDKTNIQQKIKDGVYKISRKRGCSKAWELFGTIEADTGDIISDRVACRMCYSIYKLNGKSTTNLLQHKCVKQSCTETVQIEKSHKDAITKYVTQWCIQDCVPFNKVDGLGFFSMVTNICKISQLYNKTIDVKHMFIHMRQQFQMK